MYRAFVAVLLLAAPLQAAVAQSAITIAQPELARIALTLHSATGKHRYNVELALTGAQQQAGLMFRKTLARTAGMLFPFKPAQPASFWMRNTILPLDLVFVDAGHRVLNVAADAVPYSPAFLTSDGPVIAVLELNAGEARRIGLKPGDRVDYRLP